MSKKSLSKQLLSAYFDGEVSAEERALVQLAAEVTPAIQQILDDYAQLSQTLQSLRQDVPALSSGLTESVMAMVSEAATPTRNVSPARSGRRWMRIAGFASTVAAVGLMVMIWPAGPHVVDQAEMAQNGEQPSGHAIDGRASDLAMAGNGLTTSEFATADVMSDGLPGDALALPAGNANEAPARFASNPVESLLEQVAKDRKIPQPGDVVKYLAEVAEETVWISLTVVDVQMVAGEIRVLLTNHGIESPVEVDLNAFGSSMDPNVVILVESDWEKVAEVVEDLDHQGYVATSDVATSVAQQQVQIGQNRLEPLGKPSSADGDELLTASTPSDGPSLNELAATAPASSVQVESTKARSGMLHAQLSARVSDKDVTAFELRGQPIFSSRQAGSDSLRGAETREQQKPELSAPESDEIDTRQYDTKILASPSPARVVFVIKKSK